MERALVDLLIVVVSLSMAATPLALAGNDLLSRRLARARPQRPFDTFEQEAPRVIIAGFGRVGQIVGRILKLKRIAFTALDISPEQVQTVRRFGNKVHYGDASRLDLLTAAGASGAKLFVLAIDDVEASIRTARTVRRHFPDLTVYARARNRFHAHRLMDLGVELIERETFLGSLDLARQVLEAVGMAGWEAQQIVARFQAHDEQTLRRQHAVYHDETQLIQSARQAAEELQGLFESDQEDASRVLGAPAFSPSDVR
jgi:glutathione-regulated potassium-efflux system ancillary protein KefC/glutathione-regulated potassium-efflux system protein KefB